MSRDWMSIDSDGARLNVDFLATQKFLDGKTQGAKEAADWLRDQATKLFEADKVEEAVAMRALAKRLLGELVPAFDKAAHQHATECPYRIGVKP